MKIKKPLKKLRIKKIEFPQITGKGSEWISLHRGYTDRQQAHEKNHQQH